MGRLLEVGRLAEALGAGGRAGVRRAGAVLRTIFMVLPVRDAPRRCFANLYCLLRAWLGGKSSKSAAKGSRRSGDLHAIGSILAVAQFLVTLQSVENLAMARSMAGGQFTNCDPALQSLNFGQLHKFSSYL